MVQAPWNSTPAWGYPFVTTNLANTPGAKTLIDQGFAAQVLGAGAYLCLPQRPALSRSRRLPDAQSRHAQFTRGQPDEYAADQRRRALLQSGVRTSVGQAHPRVRHLRNERRNRLANGNSRCRHSIAGSAYNTLLQQVQRRLDQFRQHGNQRPRRQRAAGLSLVRVIGVLRRKPVLRFDSGVGAGFLRDRRDAFARRSYSTR
jgi:hypothetical protein